MYLIKKPEILHCTTFSFNYLYGSFNRHLFIYSVARFLSELIIICASFHIAITNYREILEDGQLWCLAGARIWHSLM